MRELLFQFKDGRWNVVVFVARWKSFLSDQSACSVCGKVNVLQKSEKNGPLETDIETRFFCCFFLITYIYILKNHIMNCV